MKLDAAFRRRKKKRGSVALKSLPKFESHTIWETYSWEGAKNANYKIKSPPLHPPQTSDKGTPIIGHGHQPGIPKNKDM